MEHLIVGILLFTPLLALMPTTLIFYVPSFIFQLNLCIIRWIIAEISHILSNFTFTYFVLRIWKPKLFPGI